MRYSLQLLAVVVASCASEVRPVLISDSGDTAATDLSDIGPAVVEPETNCDVDAHGPEVPVLTQIQFGNMFPGNYEAFPGCGLANRQLLPCDACGRFDLCLAGAASGGDLVIDLGQQGDTGFEALGPMVDSVADGADFQLGVGDTSFNWTAFVAGAIVGAKWQAYSVPVFARTVLQFGCAPSQRWDTSLLLEALSAEKLHKSPANAGTYLLNAGWEVLQVGFAPVEAAPPHHPKNGPPDHDITGACFAVGLEIQTLDGAHCGWAAKAWHVKPPPK